MKSHRRRNEGKGKRKNQILTISENYLIPLKAENLFLLFFTRSFVCLFVVFSAIKFGI